VEASQRPTRNPNCFCEEENDVVGSRTNWMGSQRGGFACQTPRQTITNNNGFIESSGFQGTFALFSRADRYIGADDKFYLEEP
jgi:hypothetical protein